MTKPLTLIHLISEQTMQNLVPLLALKPARVVHICSRDERFRAAARHIESAAREAGLDAQFQVHELAAAVPDIEPVRAALQQTLSVFPGAVVNITGGTKLMCLGSYLGASEFPVPMLYCDTDRQQFVALGKHPLPLHPSFAEVVCRLTLRVVLAAHGKPPDAWGFSRADPARLEFGRRAWVLRGQFWEQFRRYGFNRRIQSFFFSENGRVPSGKSKLAAFCEADLTRSLPDPIPGPVTDFLSAAADAGILVRMVDGGFKVGPPPGTGDLREHVERAASLLAGSWLELAVLNFVSSSSRLLDPHWSVQPRRGQPNAEDTQSFGETDVVCIALPQGNLQVISCKTSPGKPLEHLESLRERSQNLGGRFAGATLALLGSRNDQIAELRRWSRLLGVRVLIGEEIETLSDS